MGGYGSGQWYRWSTRSVIEDGLTLDLYRLIRQNNIRPGAWTSGTLNWSVVDTGEHVASIGYEADLTDSDSAWMRLKYTRNDISENYLVDLATTRPNFGGRRWWFLCPAKRIRVTRLHLPRGGDKFASRQAYGLAYRCQNEPLEDRIATKAHRLRRRLGGEPGFDQPFPSKPKGMHWRTYNQMCDEIDWMETASMAAAMRRFGVAL